MIIGISTTKTAIIAAETKGDRSSFVITALKPIPFQVRTGDDLVELLQTLRTLLTSKGKDTGPVIALLKCSSGRFGSYLEAIKGEAMVEVAAARLGLRVVKLAPKASRKPSTAPPLKNGGTAPLNCSIPTQTPALVIPHKQ